MVHESQIPRSCDRCHTLKERCRRLAASSQCDRCARLELHCQTLRPVKRPGRRPKPHSSDFAYCRAAQEGNSSVQANSLYVIKGLSIEDAWLLDGMITNDKHLGLFVVGPSFYERHRQSLVSQFVTSRDMMKDAFMACALLWSADDATSNRPPGGDSIYRRASSAVSTLRSLKITSEHDIMPCLVLGASVLTFALKLGGAQMLPICSQILNLIKPNYLAGSRPMSNCDFLTGIVMAEISECLVHAKVPTLRIQPPTAESGSSQVDRYMGLTSAFLPHLYDLCKICSALRLGRPIDDETLTNLERTIRNWTPMVPIHLVNDFTAVEVSHMLCQAQVIPTAALVVIHRLRNPFGTEDATAVALSSSILSQLHMTRHVTGRTPRIVDLAVMVAPSNASSRMGLSHFVSHFFYDTMMDQSVPSHDDPFWAPGTVRLEDLQNTGNKIILHPIPSSDPNDPLNWSTWRKTVNLALASLYVLMTFVQLDISFTAWARYQEELGFSFGTLNAGGALNYTGLATGCIILVPLVHKYGRRPLYILSTTVQLASCIWAAKMQTRADLWASSFVSGFGGAISETIVQITIADLFFVHHHAAMNGAYLFFVAAGAFLGPVASGYVVQNQGWRWIWWWCVILLGIDLLCILFFFEESKYSIPIVAQQPGNSPDTQGIQGRQEAEHESSVGMTKHDGNSQSTECTESAVHFDHTIPLKTYRQRMPFVTKTNGSILHNLYQPAIVLFTFPAVAYTALTYASTSAAFAIVTSVQAMYLLQPPYNFTPSSIGLMSLAPFIGTFPGIFFGGYLDDKSIVWLSKRNGGIYEPEMRLWLALPLAILTAGSVLMSGLGIVYAAPWPLVAFGFGLLGFNLGASGSIALSYCMDCYHDIIGNAMVGIVFSRNALGVVVLFTVTPWIKRMGLRDMHILVSVLIFFILLTPVLLLKWGKKARSAYAGVYMEMARRQPTSRQY
ncbi:Major facilitator superfamily transporter [Fusarium austroafricanum]|uniref:Major facilitator superfamily transporter n=1 Tax=Fusarium austroafricanum TaxID=2364996 RepID=A0A8H4K6F6_9HYPO|nr:Major facilitator superfamily transporter [Fusarium austroafricanum]